MCFFWCFPECLREKRCETLFQRVVVFVLVRFVGLLGLLAFGFPKCFLRFSKVS